MASSETKYQKTNSRSSSKQRKRNVAIQSIKYLVMNPLEVNYNIKQQIDSTGKMHAELSYNY